MKTFIRLTIFFCFVFCSYGAVAQVFMRPFDNAAAMSLGGATVAYPGMETGIGNEALAGFADRAGIYLGSAIPYGIGDWQSAQLQGVFKIDRNNGIGIGLSHSGIEAYKEQRYGLVYGRRLGEKICLGGSADLLRVNAAEYGSATGFNIGIGILANPLPGLWLGVRIRNPVQQKIGEQAPSNELSIGAAWKASPILTLLAETEKKLERPTQIKAGVEYRPLPILILRAGMRTGGAARIGFGAAIRLKSGFGMDLGSEWHPSLGLTPAAMFVWRKP